MPTTILLALPPVCSDHPTALHSAIDSNEVARGLSVSRATWSPEQARLDALVHMQATD